MSALIPQAAASQLAKLDQARQMLAECRSIDDVKQIRDKAEAVRVWCKSAKLGLAAQNEAALLKIEAERKAGELLAAMEKNRGCAVPTRSHDATTLTDLGITKSDSSRWQSMAALPDDDFASYVESCRSMERELTSAEVCRRGQRAVRGDETEEPEPVTFEKAIEVFDRHCRKVFELTPSDRHKDLANHLRSVAVNLESGVFDVRG